jgi:pimeloyl-ACP methyl ester carboxylesterase
MSDMGGSKALWLEDWCRTRGRAFLRFDQSGHGQSSGRFDDGGIAQWAGDVIAVLDALTEGPQILVGSSMGGWLMLLAALARPERVAGLVGIAAAPDFTEDLMWDPAPEAWRATLMAEGRVLEPSDYGEEPYVITKTLIEEGRSQLVLRAPLPIGCPIRLIQGMADTSVPWRTALRLQEHLPGGDVAVTLVKDGDHRLSRPRDLARLGRVLEGLLADLDGD